MISPICSPLPHPHPPTFLFIDFRSDVTPPSFLAFLYCHSTHSHPYILSTPSPCILYLFHLSPLPIVISPFFIHRYPSAVKKLSVDTSLTADLNLDSSSEDEDEEDRKSVETGVSASPSRVTDSPRTKGKSPRRMWGKRFKVRHNFLIFFLHIPMLKVLIILSFLNNPSRLKFMYPYFLSLQYADFDYEKKLGYVEQVT